MAFGLDNLGRSLELHKFVKLRHRHIMTKKNKVRLRYVCGYALFLALSVGIAVKNSVLIDPRLDAAGYAASPMEIADASMRRAPVTPSAHPAAADHGEWTQANGVQDKISGGIRKASVALKRKPQAETAELRIGRGDTLTGLLEEAGINEDDAFHAVKALSKHVDPRMIRPGQVVSVQFRPGQEETSFARMTMDLDPLKQVTVRKENDRFFSDLREKRVERRLYAAETEIVNSLYGSAERAGIPPQALAEFIRLYSHNVDFQRDIQKGDKIEVLYEGAETEDGEFLKYHNLVYASLTIGGKTQPLYRYETQDGRVDYYDERGRTTRKTLMRTPIDGGRVSSGFGKRMHPILGYTKMHKGVDFAAPTGTPIYAAGDGTVNFSGRYSGYGNYVRIKHNSQLQTAYGHMSRIAKGIRNGARVKQGEVIGYVGSTGRSTGPHLHYEILLRGTQVNPRSVNLPIGENLGGKELARFKKTVGGITQQYASLLGGVKVAQASVGAGAARGLN